MNKSLVLVAGISLFFSVAGNCAEQDTAQTGETPAMGSGAMGESMPSGGSMMEQAPMMMEEPAATDEAAPEATGEVKLPGDPVQGKAIYDSVCFVCHGQGIAGAPKFGDKAAWEPRISQGMDVLVSHATSGFTGKTGTMPPKGGRMDLSDADIANGVAYMVSEVLK